MKTAKQTQSASAFTPPNARFWHWSNGWVKLTLKPGQTLSWGEYHRTDEGHSFQTCAWTHTGPEITRQWCHGGRDCDGRIETSGADLCPLDRLANVQACPDDPERFHEGRLIHRPDWKEAEQTRVYDQFAQASNY